MSTVFLCQRGTDDARTPMLRQHCMPLVGDGMVSHLTPEARHSHLGLTGALTRQAHLVQLETLEVLR